jgi:ADP-heptose:LPS heptosyltransferase
VAVKRPRVLVLRALGLGDFLTAVPALRALAEHFPEHELVLATPAALRPLVRLARAADEVIPAWPLAPLPRTVAWPDIAVNLHGCGPESHHVLTALRPRTLISFAHPAVPESGSGAAWSDDEHETRRWCRLLDEHGIRADASRVDIPRPQVGAPDWARGATIVHPGAASESRRWPAERFAAVARVEHEKGRTVLVTGDRAERALGRRVAALAGLPAECVVAGETDLLRLARLVAGAGRVICGDTGVAHLATAFATPSVVLFGPTPPALWGPPPGRAWHRVLWAGRAGDPHADTPDPGLLEIPADAVLDELAELDRQGAAVVA